MIKTYLFSYSPADPDGFTETEFDAYSEAEAMELFRDFCANDLRGFVPEEVTIVAVYDCDNTDG